MKLNMDRFRKEREELYDQQKELESNKQQLEAELLAQEKHFTTIIAEHQKLINDLSLRQPSNEEHEIMKTRIAKIVGGPYQERIANMQKDLDDKENIIEELKRHNKLLKIDIEDMKSDCEEQLKSLKRRYTRQIDELAAENQRLEIEYGTNQEQESIAMIERRQEEYKRKYNESQKALTEANRTVNNLKSELEVLDKTNKKLNEQLHIQNINTENEIEKLTDKLKRAKEEYASEVQKGLEKDKTIQQQIINIETLKAQFQQLEDENADCLRRENEIKETLRERDKEIEECILQIKSENRENSERVYEQNQILVNENIMLKNQIKDFEDGQSQQVQELLEKLQLGEKEAKTMHEEHQQLIIRTEELQTTCEVLKNNYDKANNHNNKLELEVASLQTLYRNSLIKGQELMTIKEHLELSLQLLKDENQSLKADHSNWDTERKELQNQITSLTKKLEVVTKESADKLKGYAKKRSEYRAKLREANLRLQQMSSHIAHLQAETYQLPKQEMFNAFVLKTGTLTPDSSKLEADIERTLQSYAD